MIIGIGVDVVDLARFERATSRTPGVLTRLFADSEQWDGDARRSLSSLAARFAAKEAVMKALGTGVRGVGWRDIEVLPNRRGKPLVFLYGRGAARAEQIEMRALEVSLTHSNDFAIASVVGERAMTDAEDTPRRGEAALRLIREKGLR